MYCGSPEETPSPVESDSELDDGHDDRDHARARLWSLSCLWIYWIDTRFPHTPAYRYNMFSVRMIRSLSIPEDLRER